MPPFRAFLAPLLLLSASLAGCTVGPSYRPPSPPRLGSIAEAGQAVSGEAPSQAWWRLWGDPALDRLVAAAAAENRDLRTAEANLEQARAAVDAARASFLPTATVSGGSTRGRSPGESAGSAATGLAVPADWTTSESAALSQAIDVFGRARRALEAARGDAEAAAAARDLARVSAEAATARAYLDACALAAELKAARRSAETAAQTAEQTARLQALGNASTFDLERARSLEAQSRAAVPSLGAQREAALLELAALTGRADGTDRDAAACEAAPKLGAAVLPVGDAAGLLRRRPDVRQAERRLAAETARIGVATADLYPSVTITASFSSAATRLPALGSPAALTYGLGPLVSWSLPAGDARARLEGARASAAAALSEFDAAVLSAVKELRQALAALEAERSRRGALDIARETSARAFSIARARLDLGGASYLDLLTAQANLAAADQALAASDQALAEDEVAVFRALGAG